MKVGHLLLPLYILVLTGQSLFAAQSRSSDQPLFQAVAKGDMGAVRVSLDNGADINAHDDDEDTPLIAAVNNRNIAMVKLLLERGASIQARNKYEGTALSEAARTMDAGILRIILAANPDVKDKNAALFEAAHEGPVVLQMPAASAPSGHPNPQASTTAQEPPWVTTVRLLLDSGANIEARDEDGETPLMMAASYGQTEIFNLLVDRGAKVNIRDRRGMTPLIAAACACALATMNGTYEIMKILLEKGANVNARSHDGRTALMMAAGSPDDPVSVKLLLSKGADPAAKDNQGETAITFARRGPYPEKVRMLKKAIAGTH